MSPKHEHQHGNVPDVVARAEEVEPAGPRALGHLAGVDQGAEEGGHAHVDEQGVVETDSVGEAVGRRICSEEGQMQKGKETRGAEQGEHGRS